MIKVSLNGELQDLRSSDEFGVALHEIDRSDAFELWLSAPQGQSICMLRNASNAWLMYLRHADGDDGLRSQGDSARSGVTSYRLGNGQLDEYPLSWCIDVAQCYKALAYFYAHDGAKAPWINWHES